MPPPLSAADLAAFDRDGFVVLREAVPRAVALACRDALWAKLERDRGIRKDEPATWAKAEGGRVGLAEAYGGDDLGAPWDACWSPRLVAAVDQLCGEDRWERPGLGWWVVNFPARGGAGAWHVDGSHFKHMLASPEIGLAPMLLFSDVAEGGDGTMFWPGSHLERTRYDRWHAALGRSASLEDDATAMAEMEAPGCPAGGAIVFDFRLLHRGMPNTGGRERAMAHAVLSTGLAADQLSFPEASLRAAVDALPRDPESAEHRAQREAVAQQQREAWAAVRSSSAR